MRVFAVLGLAFLFVCALASAAPASPPAPAVPAAPVAVATPVAAALFLPSACAPQPVSAAPAGLVGTNAVTCTHTQCQPCFLHGWRCGQDPVNPSLGCVCLH